MKISEFRWFEFCKMDVEEPGAESVAVKREFSSLKYANYFNFEDTEMTNEKLFEVSFCVNIYIEEFGGQKRGKNFFS